MKAEINNENKAKFFALYLNQKLLCDNLRSGERLDKSWNWSHPDFWINLKPLSSISDEDASLICEHHKVISSDNKWSVNSGIVLDGYSTDYLRSKGYALPWMGLSVEEMVEAGWIKLT